MHLNPMLTVLRQEKKAKKIRLEFKVPNKRWWWIKIRGFAAAGKWDSLRRFSQQKSPIGYKPFAEVCETQTWAKIYRIFTKNLIYSIFQKIHNFSLFCCYDPCYDRFSGPIIRFCQIKLISTGLHRSQQHDRGLSIHSHDA